MADEKLNTGPAENTSRRPPSLSPHPNRPQHLNPSRNRPGLPYLSPAMWLCPLTKSMSLWRKRGRTARAEVEKAETPETPEAVAPGETPQPANTEEPKKPRPWPSAESGKAATENQKAEKIGLGPAKGRPPKADKAAPDKPKPSKRGQSVPK